MKGTLLTGANWTQRKLCSPSDLIILEEFLCATDLIIEGTRSMLGQSASMNPRPVALHTLNNCIFLVAVKTLAIYLVYPLPWNSVLLKLLITVCCEDEEREPLRTKMFLFWNEAGLCTGQHTSILPHVWKAVNINIKPKPRIMMFNSLFPSGLILQIPWGSVDIYKMKNKLLERTAHLKIEEVEVEIWSVWCPVWL